MVVAGGQEEWKWPVAGARGVCTVDANIRPFGGNPAASGRLGSRSTLSTSVGGDSPSRSQRESMHRKKDRSALPGSDRR